MPSQPKPEDHFRGLKVVYDCKEEKHRVPLFRKSHKVDIVAIHGIGAWSIATWSGKSSTGKRVNWLRDPEMLPKQVPNSRIMIYGYESNWKGHDTIRTTAQKIAVRLIDSLIGERKHTPSRPIIFIAHCFGGIVVMKAMSLARHGHPTLLRSVAGIVFFGTPFRGINGALGDGRIEQYVRANGLFVEGDILSVLRPEDQGLSDILEDFTSIGTHALQLPTMICLYEQKASKVWAIAGDPNGEEEIIVPSRSCVLDSANVKLGMERNHFDMNKFTGPDDSEYCMIVRHIEKLAENAPGYVEKRHKYRLPRSQPSAQGPSMDTQQIQERQHSSQFAHEGPQSSQHIDSTIPAPDGRETIARSSLFLGQDWREEKINRFDTSHVSWSSKLSYKKAWVKSASFAAGISADCTRVFQLSSWGLFLSLVPNDRSDNIASVKIDPPPGCEYHVAKMGSSVAAVVCTQKRSIMEHGCFIKRVVQQDDQNEPWHRVPDEPSDEDETRTYTCIAVHETREHVLVAVGTRNSTRTKAHVRIYLVDTISWNSHEICEPYELRFVSEGRNSGSSDPAKILNFSSDGKLLICSTFAQNRVLVWKITGDTELRLEKICSTVRRFGAEMNVQAITGAKCWHTSIGHPYILVTTSPGSQRSRPGHEGEFSFIAPASDPFPAFGDHAFHCLIEAQHKVYYSLIDGAVTNSGNAVALLSNDGKIGVMPLQRLASGGIESFRETPIPIRGRLGPLLNVFEAAVRFSPDDRRLVAVDKLGNLIVANFSDPRSQDLSPWNSLTPGSGQSDSTGGSSRHSNSQRPSRVQWSRLSYRSQPSSSRHLSSHPPRLDLEFEPDDWTTET